MPGTADLLPPKLRRLFDSLIAHEMCSLPRDVVEKVKIKHSAEEDARWRRSKRGFCHANPRTFTIYCCKAIASLPKTAILGIWLHELGHLVLRGRFKDIDIEEVEVDRWVQYVAPHASYTYRDCKYRHNGKQYIAHNLQTVSLEYIKWVLSDKES